MILAATRIRARYPGRRTNAVDDVSVELRPGELVAVAGPNGSGKTTLLRALHGAIEPSGGEVTLDNEPLLARSRRDIARVVGVLPQREEPAFAMSVRDAITMGRWAHLGAFRAPGRADVAAIDSAVARCNIGDLMDRSIDTLSGGEWQRVRLARTLAGSPRLLLLDEPSAALDVGHEMALFELLLRFAREGLGVLVITHQLNVAARFVDRIALMNHGRIVADGDPATAIDAATMSAVFDWPVDVGRLDDGTPHVVPRRAGRE